MNDETICPLCGQHHFEENDDFEECRVCGWVNDGENAFEECPICGWVDDLVQRLDHNCNGGFNRISVNEAKKKFAAGKKVFD